MPEMKICVNLKCCPIFWLCRIIIVAVDAPGELGVRCRRPLQRLVRVVAFQAFLVRCNARMNIRVMFYGGAMKSHIMPVGAPDGRSGQQDEKEFTE